MTALLGVGLILSGSGGFAVSVSILLRGGYR